MKTVLTSSTKIPTAARGKVRAFIKSRPEFLGWLSNNNIESRLVSNQQLLLFALAHGYAGQVEDLIDNAGSLPALSSYVDQTGPCDSIDEAIAMAQEKIRTVAIEGEASSGMAAHSVDSVLAGVDQFLSPFVKAEISKALEPLVAAANKPAEVIVRETMPVAPTGALPYAKPGNKASVGSIFGFKGQYAAPMATLWDGFGAAPAIDPFYVVDPFNMAMVATAFERGTNVWLGGPGGSGKSTLPEQFCANVGRPFVKISFTRQTNVEDLVGGMSLTEGSTAWQDGVLVQAMRRPGTVILLDELTLAPAGVQGIVQGVADDHRSLTLPTGEKVRCAPGVVFCVADNTFGYGDETGQYAGTNQSNAALVNRFKRMLKIRYMDAATEAQALANHTGAPLKAARHMADFMAKARKMPQMENIVLSLRQMTGFVQCCQDGFGVKEAAQATILNQLPSTERAALETLFTLEWSATFAALLDGSADPKAAKPANSPSGSPAAVAFDDEISASINR